MYSSLIVGVNPALLAMIVESVVSLFRLIVHLYIMPPREKNTQKIQPNNSTILIGNMTDLIWGCNKGE